MSQFVIEMLEHRRLCYASIPSGDVALQTIQIRPAAGTYTSELTLAKGVTYFLRATGYTRKSTNVYAGDAAFEATTATSTTTTTTTASTWGITTNVGTITFAPTAWGAIKSDHVYGQYITPTKAGALSFTFANDATDKISTLAVTVFAPAPAISVAKIHTDSVSGTVVASTLGSSGVIIPLNDADWDHNGIADDKQTGAVAGDKFLVPLTLPKIVGASTNAHYSIDAPRGVRVWLNADRTGSTVGYGLRATAAHTVFIEGISEQPATAAVDLAISVPIAGISVSEKIPVSVFSLAGPVAVTGGTKQVYTSDSVVGTWRSAIAGTLDTANISVHNGIAYANVIWNDTPGIGYADFQANADYLWGWPVEITS